jgi:hypothetical protein
VSAKVKTSSDRRENNGLGPKQEEERNKIISTMRVGSRIIILKLEKE